MRISNSTFAPTSTTDRKRILGNAPRRRLAFGRPNSGLVAWLVGDVQRPPVNAHHSPLPVLRPGLRPARPVDSRANNADASASSRPSGCGGLRDRLVGSHAQPPRGLCQPLEAIEWAAQPLAARRMHLHRQRYGDDHHKVSSGSAAGAGARWLARSLPVRREVAGAGCRLRWPPNWWEP